MENGKQGQIARCRVGSIYLYYVVPITDYILGKISYVIIRLLLLLLGLYSRIEIIKPINLFVWGEATSNEPPKPRRLITRLPYPGCKQSVGCQTHLLGILASSRLLYRLSMVRFYSDCKEPQPCGVDPRPPRRAMSSGRQHDFGLLWRRPPVVSADQPRSVTLCAGLRHVSR